MYKINAHCFFFGGAKFGIGGSSAPLEQLIFIYCLNRRLIRSNGDLASDNEVPDSVTTTSSELHEAAHSLVVASTLTRPLMQQRSPPVEVTPEQSAVVQQSGVMTEEGEITTSSKRVKKDAEEVYQAPVPPQPG